MKKLMILALLMSAAPLSAQTFATPAPSPTVADEGSSAGAANATAGTSAVATTGSGVAGAVTLSVPVPDYDTAALCDRTATDETAKALCLETEAAAREQLMPEIRVQDLSLIAKCLAAGEDADGSYVVLRDCVIPKAD